MKIELTVVERQEILTALYDQLSIVSDLLTMRSGRRLELKRLRTRQRRIVRIINKLETKGDDNDTNHSDQSVTDRAGSDGVPDAGHGLG